MVKNVKGLVRVSKNLKDSTSKLLKRRATSEDTGYTECVALGKNPTTITYSDLLAYALFKQALSGSVAAIKEIRSIIEDHVERTTVIKIVDDVRGGGEPIDVQGIVINDRPAAIGSEKGVGNRA